MQNTKIQEVNANTCLDLLDIGLLYFNLWAYSFYRNIDSTKRNQYQISSFKKDSKSMNIYSYEFAKVKTKNLLKRDDEGYKAYYDMYIVLTLFHCSHFLCVQVLVYLVYYIPR